MQKADAEIRWLVIGVGDITSKRAIPAILAEPRSSLVGIVTRSPAKAERYEVPGFTDLGEALRETGANGVYVATPVAYHAPQTIESLRAGKHVLCEKPVAMSYAEACSMVDAAKEADRTLGIAYYRRSYPHVNRAKELLASGAIGKPVFAYATSHAWFWPAGERDWFMDPALAGGGPLYDIASHRIDLMNYLFGPPRAARGFISSLVHPPTVEDNATVLVEYESGVRGCIDVRWHSRVVRDEFYIRGTDGEMDLSPLNSGNIVWPGGRECVPPHANLHYPCVENFVDSLVSGTQPRATGQSSVLTDWVTEQVKLSQ